MVSLTSTTVIQLTIQTFSNGDTIYFDDNNTFYTPLSKCDNVQNNDPSFLSSLFLDDLPSSDFIQPTIHAGIGLSYPLICTAIVLVLLILLALFSGMNLTWLSIDNTKSKLMRRSAIQYNHCAAKKLVSPKLSLPCSCCESNRQMVLTTLLIANTIAMEAIPVFLHEILAGWLAIVISVVVVIICGSIIPQASLPANPIKIANKLSCPMKGLQIILYWLARPLSYILERVFTKDSHQKVLFTRAEINSLMEYLNKKQKIFQPSTADIDPDELHFVESVAKLKELRVSQQMTQWDDTNTLDANLPLDINGLRNVLRFGLPRIPVYSGRRNNIVGLCFVRDVIHIDPSPKDKLRNYVTRYPTIMAPDTNMMQAINIFQTDSTHFALITKDIDIVRKCFDDKKDIPQNVSFQGCITLEDIMEELIQEELIQEELYDTLGVAQHESIPTNIESINLEPNHPIPRAERPSFFVPDPSKTLSNVSGIVPILSTNFEERVHTRQYDMTERKQAVENLRDVYKDPSVPQQAFLAMMNQVTTRRLRAAKNWLQRKSKSENFEISESDQIRDTVSDITDGLKLTRYLIIDSNSPDKSAERHPQSLLYTHTSSDNYKTFGKKK